MMYWTEGLLQGAVEGLDLNCNKKFTLYIVPEYLNSFPKIHFGS